MDFRSQGMMSIRRLSATIAREMGAAVARDLTLVGRWIADG
jgi:hypothetical protein